MKTNTLARDLLILVAAAAILSVFMWPHGASAARTGVAAFGGYFTISPANANNVYYNTGTVGIGTSTPAAQLDIAGILGNTNDLLNVSSTTANNVVQSFFKVRSSGAVGLGTSTPNANFQANATTTNATTTAEFGSAGQNKGSCLKLYRTDGSAIYAYVAAGATAFTLSTAACGPGSYEAL